MNEQVSDSILKLVPMIDALSGEVFLYLNDGPLKDKLVESYLETEEAHGDILEFEFDASLRIIPAADSAAATIEGRLELDDFLYQTSFTVAELDADETTDLLEQLQPHCPAPSSEQDQPRKNILRKKQGNNLLNIGSASITLGLSQRALKTLIPCSEMRIVEEGGDKSIEGYYWNKGLIARFEALAAQHRQGQRYTDDDAAFVAEQCCDGDMKWARDIIAGFLQHKR
ncbi:MAG: hypothetical protein J7K75_01030 [Desulfuromonas sp.]|nr:hypothetical protein [Desulfuromonas sp.]